MSQVIATCGGRAQDFCGPSVAPRTDPMAQKQSQKQPKKRLTDVDLRSLPPAEKGKRYEVRDNDVRGLLVRVTDRGKRTLMLQARFPGSSQSTRRELGEYGSLKLAAARELARDWHELIRRGIDPSAARRATNQATEKRRESAFGPAVEKYISEKVIGPDPAQPLMRNGKETARILRKEFVPRWDKRLLGDLSADDILALIENKALKTPSMARNMLAILRAFFVWAVHQRGRYGLKSSPCAGIRPSAINKIGDKPKRQRALTDEEVRLFWRSASRLRDPYGPAYQMLLLTGLRANEVADAARTEFKLAKTAAASQWIIPPGRMKGKNGHDRAHLVPLTQPALDILKRLPNYGDDNPYLFSTTGGEKPVYLSSKMKDQLAARMLQSKKAMLRKRGKPYRDATIPHFVIHDLRRTVRTNLSALDVKEEVREAVLAHAKPGIKGVYDVYEFAKEKRQALELWNSRLAQILAGEDQ